MKTIIVLAACLLILACSSTQVYSQQCPTAQNFKKPKRMISELSVGFGGAHYFGDLNTYNTSDRRITGELHKENMFPAFGVNYRFYPSRFINPKLGLFYTRLRGSDRNNHSETDDFTISWFRQYRNLSFRTDVLELSASAEFNILGFEPGNMRRIMSPFISAGVGVIFFDPKAPYNSDWVSQQTDNVQSPVRNAADYKYDKWVRLQPLGTEGQGLPGNPDKYKLIQHNYILGLGVKCNISPSVTLSWQVNHHFTHTDYLDDVSTVYPDVQDFYKYYDYEKAQLVANLSVRSKEFDPSGQYSYITSEGQQRGSTKHNDSYMTSMLTVGFILNRNTQKSGSQNPDKIQKKEDKKNQKEEEEEIKQQDKIKLYKKSNKKDYYKDKYFNKRPSEKLDLTRR